MAQQQQGQGQGEANSLDFFWVIVLLIAAIGAIWYFGKSYIITGTFYIRSYEIIVLDYVLNYWNQLAQALHIPIVNTASLTQVQSFIQSNPSHVGFETLAVVSSVVGDFLRYPVVVLLTLFAGLAYLSNVKMKFKHFFNMKRLRDLERQNWPQIIPVIKAKLLKTDIDKGPWRMAESPMQFAKKHDLLKVDLVNGKHVAKALAGPAYRVFALQLGPRWMGADRLPIHAQAIFAIFAARANRDSDAAENLIRQIGNSAESGKLDFSGVKELLYKYMNTKPVMTVCARHAYIYTVMATMLELARTDGVIATAEFIWLKPVDRRLWYVLNNVGRKTAFPEISGPFAHWVAEKRMGRPLAVPMVKEAVTGLESAIDEILYEPDEE